MNEWLLESVFLFLGLLFFALSFNIKISEAIKAGSILVSAGLFIALFATGDQCAAWDGILLRCDLRPALFLGSGAGALVNGVLRLIWSFIEGQAFKN